MSGGNWVYRHDWERPYATERPDDLKPDDLVEIMLHNEGRMIGAAMLWSWGYVPEDARDTPLAGKGWEIVAYRRVRLHG